MRDRLLLRRAVDAAAALRDVVDVELDDGAAGVRRLQRGLGRGVRRSVAELRGNDDAVRDVIIHVPGREGGAVAPDGGRAVQDRDVEGLATGVRGVVEDVQVGGRDVVVEGPFVGVVVGHNMPWPREARVEVRVPVRDVLPRNAWRKGSRCKQLVEADGKKRDGDLSTVLSFPVSVAVGKKTISK